MENKTIITPDRFGESKPEDFIVDLVDKESGETRKYMKVDGRIIGFWREFPKGRIRLEESYNPEKAEYNVEAFLYELRTDPLDNYMVKEFGSDVSLTAAANQAIRNALGRLGFGICVGAILNPDEKDIPDGMLPKAMLSDASIKKIAEGQGSKRGRKPKTASKSKENSIKVEESIDTVDVSEPLAEVEQIEPEVIAVKSDKKEKTKVETTKPKETEVLTPETAPIPPKAEEVVDAKEESAVTDLENMSIAEALKIKIPFGQKKGQFMGEVYATDPNAIRWYAEKYAGDNKEVRKAAQVILSNK